MGIHRLATQYYISPNCNKGILIAEDVREALHSDTQGIIVSNHGGNGARQLDGVPATVSV